MDKKKDQGLGLSNLNWDLDKIFGYGNYQRFQIWIIQSLIAMLGAMNFYHLVFMVSEPPKWECQDPSMTNCSSVVDSDLENDTCGGGEVVFDETHQNFIHSLAVEHKWLCSTKQRGAWVISATYFGQILNSLIFGPLLDTWGRKPVFHLTNVIFIILRVLSFHLTSYYWAFLLLTAFGTGFFPVGVRAGYTIIAELCDDRARKYAFISGWVWWVVGLALLPFLAKWLGDWYLLGMATTLCNLVFVAMYPVLPESPRWLIGKGRYNEAANIISKMRKYNNADPIPNLEELLQKVMPMQDSSQTSNFGITTMVKNWSLLRLIICMSAIWTVNDYFYIAGSMNVENLAGDMFVNFCLLSLTEMPSVFIGQFLIDRLGRRWVHVLCMTISTLPFFVIIFLAADPNNGTILVILSVISKSASNVGWFVMWVQCIEVFPTPIRGTSMNIFAVVSTLITMTSPFVVDLGKDDLRFPFIIFTGFGIVGMFATSLVPETKGVTLPDRIEDLYLMIKKFKFWKWRSWKKLEAMNELEERVMLQG